MTPLRNGLVLLGLIFISFPATASDNSGRIYGKITTVDGDIYRGYIRWDKNEASWVDVLNGNKELPDRDEEATEPVRHKHQAPRIEIFGLKIGGSTFSPIGPEPPNPASDSVRSAVSRISMTRQLRLR